MQVGKLRHAEKVHTVNERDGLEPWYVSQLLCHHCDTNPIPTGLRWFILPHICKGFSLQLADSRQGDMAEGRGRRETAPGTVVRKQREGSAQEEGRETLPGRAQGAPSSSQAETRP